MREKGDVGVGGESSSGNMVAKCCGVAFWGFDDVRLVALVQMANSGENDAKWRNGGVFGRSKERANKSGSSYIGKITRGKVHE